MLLPIQYVADWTRIALQKQKRIDESNKHENSSRIPHTYKPGDKVLIIKPRTLPKVESPQKGPYSITEIHNNGTVTIKDGPVLQQGNIHHITPCWTRMLK